jgi:hypothetical protein
VTEATKPLGRKAYGHIAHLPGSRVGPGDHTCHEGQARICTEKARDRHDRIIVQEKLDGSCCAVAKIDGSIVPLIRAGYRAEQSHYEQHRLFAAWVYERQDAFAAVLQDGERLVGEWLAQAHGTRYNLRDRDPFVVFDLMHEDERATVDELTARLEYRFDQPVLLHAGGPLAVKDAMALLAEQQYLTGAVDEPEGCVWRVERYDHRAKRWRVDFLAKYVRPDKQDGCYLPEISSQPAVWNWRPSGHGQPERLKEAGA